jgi:hypothetical protein
MFFRVGRQRVVWGDGRLLGESDWSPSPRALDAARFGFQVSDFDVELMAALLIPPGTYTAPPTDAGSPSALSTRSTGAQLYGLDVKWRFLPLLNAELTGLARISRSYYAFGSPPLTPGDTYVIDARIFGDRRGFQYAVEGAYELGRVASYEVNRDVSAFAVAARASLETALPAHLTFNLHGAYASGDGGDGSNPGATLTRFDPILPDEFANHSPMGLYGWSNIIEAGAGVKATPTEELTLQAGYRFAAFASKGRWITSSLLEVGDVTAEGFPILGHEIDAAVTFTPWDPIEFKAGYGLFLFGDAAKSLASDPSGSGMQHWAFLQTLVRAP